MHIRQARESDRDAVLGLYRELRPSDPPLTSDKASELWSKVNEAPPSWPSMKATWVQLACWP